MADLLTNAGIDPTSSVRKPRSGISVYRKIGILAVHLLNIEDRQDAKASRLIG